MNIYEIGHDKTSEIKALGHHAPFSFCQAVKAQTGIRVNIGDVKLVYERRSFKRGSSVFINCSPCEFGANPVTVVEV